MINITKKLRTIGIEYRIYQLKHYMRLRMEYIKKEVNFIVGLCYKGVWADEMEK